MTKYITSKKEHNIEYSLHTVYTIEVEGGVMDWLYVYVVIIIN